jgi:hypothetical protein
MHQNKSYNALKEMINNEKEKRKERIKNIVK